MTITEWIGDYFDPHDFFGVVAQVIPVLLLVLVVEREMLKRWLKQTGEEMGQRHRKTFIFLAVSGELAALVFTMIKIPEDAGPYPAIPEFFMTLLLFMVQVYAST